MSDASMLRRRLGSAEVDDRVRAIPAGSTVFVAGFGAAPTTLTEALVAFGADGGRFDVLTSIMLPTDTPFTRWSPDAGVIRLLYVARSMTQGVAAGWADPLPVSLSSLPGWIDAGRLPIDVACIEVTPPDASGRCHLGLSVDVTPEAVRAADLVLAEVNPNLPRVPGSGWVDVADIHASTEVDRPLPAFTPPCPEPIDRRIADHVAALVPMGATIQLGVGGVMEAIADALCGHHDLSIRSGLLTDGLMRMIESGAVTSGSSPGGMDRSVATSVIGSAALHRFVDGNDAIRLEPVRITHDIASLGALPCFVAVNSVWEVALDGSVNAERRGARSMGGVGGQVDFVVGAALSDRGRSIIALHSTAEGGTVSRIVPFLEEATPVTTPRCFADRVVTEHGAADLGGLGVAERAEALISIADPRHRGALARSLA